MLGACARFTPLPLPATPHAAPGLAQLNHAGIDISRPLSLAAISALALRNAPQIRATIATHRLAWARYKAAGVLPNPQFSGAFLPLLAGFGTTPGYNYVITEDIRALVTYHARNRGARDQAYQVDAELLWQAWQVVATARALAVNIVADENALALRQSQVKLQNALYAATRAAVAQGNLTALDLAPVRDAAQQTTAQIAAQRAALQSSRLALNALLGLAPSVALTLEPTLQPPPVDPAAIRAAIPDIANRRPDLIALRLGYAAENQALRVAILSQFPPFALGAQGNSDNANVRNLGPQINVDIPMFDLNQGGVAIARATRRQLRDAYGLRLDSAGQEISAALITLRRQGARLATLRATLPPLLRDEAHAGVAFAAGTLTLPEYANLALAALARQQEILAEQAALSQTCITLATLTGADLPQIRLTAHDRLRSLATQTVSAP